MVRPGGSRPVKGWRSFVLLTALVPLACAERAAPGEGDASLAVEVGAVDRGTDAMAAVCAAWRCWTEGERTFCDNPKNPGLPAIGFWSCHLIGPPRRSVPTWRCRGAVPKGGLIETVVPCASEWRCAQLGANSQHDIYRCEKADGPLDRPPAALRGGRRAVCVKGSGWGTLCELTDLPGEDPWGVGGRCSPGAKLWCPASKESWGQVPCGAHGRWATRLEGTVQVLDCRPLPGRGPDSGCTCFLRHGALSAECCERTDCVVPLGGDRGRSCEPSTGALCDYCNVNKPECVSGGLCMVTGGENYCARDCSQAACPTGFRCAELPGSGKHQCLPEDGSCYF